MDAATVTAITAAVDFETVLTGIGAVFAAMVVLRVAIAGGRRLLSIIR